MKQIYFLLLLLSFLSLSMGEVCFEPGQCNEVPVTFTATETDADCLTFCKDEEACNWFTWFSDTVCITYASCDLNQDCGDGLTCVSGEKSCSLPDEAQCGVPGQCQAVPIGNQIVNSPQECLTNICQPDPDCEWFTFDSSSGICLIFHDCPSLDDSCETCISGENDCTASEYQCGITGQCQNTPIGTSVQFTVDDCLYYCQTDSECEWFTYDTSSTVCLIFNACDNIDDSCTSCITGENECQPSGSTVFTTTTTTEGSSGSTLPPNNFENVVVIGGYTGSDLLNDVETKDLTDSQNCDKPRDIPEALRELSGAYAFGKLTITGGITSNGQSSKAIYTLDPSDGAWNDGPDMISSRSYHATVVNSDGMIVMGGLSDSDFLDSTEVFNGNSWSEGSFNLPAPMIGFCAVQLDNDKTFISGGTTDDESFSAKTYVYTKGMGWSPSFDMAVGRLQHGCVKIDDEIIAVAGTGPSGSLKTVEIYNIASGTWSAGPDLPYGLQAPDLVVVNGEAVVMGGLGGSNGLSGSYYALRGNTWEEIGELETPRYEHVAIMVPDEALNGC